MNSSGTAAAVDETGTPPSPRRGLLSSLIWALAIPTALTCTGWLAQYSYGITVVAVTLALAVVATAAILAGTVWHRGGAAILAAVSGFALMLFAGTGLYELYMETLGRPVPAVIKKVEHQTNPHGPAMFCTVVETTGDHAVHVITEQENCHGQFKPRQPVTLRADPLGLLAPRLPSSPDETTFTTRLKISIALFALTGGAVAYAGLRRR